MSMLIKIVTFKTIEKISLKRGLVFLFIFVVSMIFAENIPTVVVAPFTATDGIDQSEVNIIQSMFTSSYAATKKAKVVDRSKFNLIQEQMQFQSSDWSNSDKVAEFGRALNAAHVITGEFTKFPKGIYVNIQVLDVNTTMIVASITPALIVKETLDVIDKLSEICDKLATEASNTSVLTVKKNEIKMYKIGNTGVGGGIVFYVSEEGFPVYEADGSKKICHYMEVSNIDIGVLSWCSYSIAYTDKGCNIPTNDGFGFGKLNTYRIIHNHTVHRSIEISEKNCAALACYNYQTPTTNKGDWFLPNRSEIEVLFKNISARIHVNPYKNAFWTSSNDSVSHAVFLTTVNGYIAHSDYKNSIYSVRAVHAF